MSCHRRLFASSWEDGKGGVPVDFPAKESPLRLSHRRFKNEQEPGLKNELLNDGSEEE